MIASDLKPGMAMMNAEGHLLYWMKCDTLLSPVFYSRGYATPESRTCGFATEDQLADIPGEWQQVGPVTPLSELPNSDWCPGGMREFKSSDAKCDWLRRSDVEGRCLVDDEQLNKLNTQVGHLEADKKELQQHVRELESENAQLKADAIDYNDTIGVQAAVIERLQSENAELRKQLAEKWGELVGDRVTKASITTIVWGRPYRSSERLKLTLYDPLGSMEYYEFIDPRPMPTLPEPEPLPQVPKCLNRDYILGCVHDVDDTEEVVQFCTLVEGSRIHVVYSDGGVGDYDATQMAIYTGQVRLPDGTATTIEPDPALVAALEGE